MVPVEGKVKISQNFVAFSEYMNFTTVLRSGAAVDFFAGAEPIIGLEFVIMLATARELTQPRALRSHYLDHDGCS